MVLGHNMIHNHNLGSKSHISTVSQPQARKILRNNKVIFDIVFGEISRDNDRALYTVVHSTIVHCTVQEWMSCCGYLCYFLSRWEYSHICDMYKHDDSSYTIWTITFIVVTDTEVPNITCVEFGAMAFWQMAATDNSGDVPEITCYQPSTTNVTTEQTTVMCEAVDTNENKAECYLQTNTTGRNRITYLLYLRM